MATFFVDEDYQGDTFQMKVGEEISNLKSVDKNDSFDAIRVEKGAKVCLYKDSGFHVDELCFTEDVAKLDDYDYGDEISSIKVSKNCNHEVNTWNPDCFTSDQNLQLRQKTCDDPSKAFEGSGKLNNQCQRFCSEHSDKCNESFKAHCTDSKNVSSPLCSQWCRENKGICDSAAQDYCNKHPDEGTFCACFPQNALNSNQFIKNNSAAKDQFSILPPKCWNKSCLDSNAYQNVNTKDYTCQPMCFQSMFFDENAAKSINFHNIKQNCSFPGAPTPVPTTTKKEDDSFGQSSKKPINKKQTILIIIIVLVIFLILCSLFIYSI